MSEKVARFSKSTLAATIAAGVLLVALASSLVERTTPQQVARMDAVEIYSFPSIEKMVATSDVVVHAEAISVEPGRVLHDGEESYLQYREVILETREVYGPGKSSRHIILEEIGWDTGVPMLFEGMEWTEEGDSGYFFLHERATRPGTHTYVSSQGRYLVQDGRLVGAPTDGSDEKDATIERVELLEPNELTLLLRDAARMVKEGSVKPCDEEGC